MYLSSLNYQWIFNIVIVWFIIWIVVREVRTWYWKQNEIVRLLKEQNELIETQNELLENCTIIKNNTEGIEQS